MKRLFVLLLCACLFLCSCGGNEGGYYMEKEITAFVLEHENELRQQIENTDIAETLREWDGVEDVQDRRASYGIVYFEFSATGLMTSSLQAGFYYSADDTPSPHGGAGWAGGYGWSEMSAQEENLWRYEEDRSDNYLITRKICDHFYYVLAAN